jgi:hypothetical protein
MGLLGLVNGCCCCCFIVIVVALLLPPCHVFFAKNTSKKLQNKWSSATKIL